MKQAFILLAATAIIGGGCSKSSDSVAGIVLHAQTNYTDSMIINKSTYTIQYLGNVYTYAPTSTPSANYLTVSITYNGTAVAPATITTNTYTTLEITAPNSVFLSTVYVGL